MQVNKIPLLRSFHCSKCRVLVLPTKGFYSFSSNVGYNYSTLICTNCGFFEVWKTRGGEKELSSFDFFSQKIGSDNKYNEKIKNLTGTNLNIFKQIQFCANYRKWESVILLSRILIMHVAIEKSAQQNQKFFEYIEYLHKKHILKPQFIKLLNLIRKWGNELNHEYNTFSDENQKTNEQVAKLCIEIVIDILNHLYKYKNLESEIESIDKNKTQNQNTNLST